MRRFFMLLVTLSLAALASAQQPSADRFQKVVEPMVKAINEGNYAGIGKNFAQTMENFFPLEKRKPFFQNLSAQYGKIQKLDEPRLILPNQAIFVAHCERGKLDIKVWLNGRDKVVGLEFLPHTAERQLAKVQFEKVVSRMVKAINEADYPAIQQDFGQVMLDAFPLEKSKPFFTNLTALYGKIQRLDPPKYNPPNQAIFPAHFERGVFDIKVVLDNEGKIIGLWFLPHTADIATPVKHKTRLSLPFKKEWLVFWGGDTKELNLHHDVPNQRFAFDFLGVDENGKTHKADGRANEDYFAFGREVLAPAEGIVTDVINGVRDNSPGSMNAYSALGNAVFIQHYKHEVSVLAHLKLDSIKVKVGDEVKSGQVIGLCGNSGNSSEPHLHYHLQNTPVIQDGTGIKCYFQKVLVVEGGKEVTKTNYSPIKGQIISAK